MCCVIVCRILTITQQNTYQNSFKQNTFQNTCEGYTGSRVIGPGRKEKAQTSEKKNDVLVQPVLSKSSTVDATLSAASAKLKIDV